MPESDQMTENDESEADRSEAGFLNQLIFVRSRILTRSSLNCTMAIDVAEADLVSSFC